MHSRSLIAILILVISFLLCLISHRYGHNWGGDFSLYIHQTKSLIEGGMESLAVQNQFTVQNSSVSTFSPVLYPWGFPMLLAPVYAFFGMNYFAFKLLEAVLLIGALLMMYLSFRKNNRLSSLEGLLFLAITAFNLVYIQATDNVLSGIPFLFFSFLGLFLILRLLESPKENQVVLSIFCGIILFFSFSIRTEGIGLFIALLVGQMQHFKYSNFRKDILIYVLPYASGFVLFLLGRTIFPSGFTSHFDYAPLVSWETSLTNLSVYLEWLEVHLFGVTLVPFFIYLVLGFALIGILHRIREDLVLITYFIFLVVLFTIWPFRELRYLYSIYPFILYFFIQGIGFLIIFSRNSSVVKFASIFLLALCLTRNLADTAKATEASIQIGEIITYGPESPESLEMFSFIKEHTNEEDVVAFFKPRVMHLYTDRVSLALFHEEEELLEKAEYFVENTRAGSYFQIPVSASASGNYPFLEKIFSNNGFNIYKINKH